jgi:hypothetical protein
MTTGGGGGGQVKGIPEIQKKKPEKKHVRWTRVGIVGSRGMRRGKSLKIPE